ncbi:SUMO-specific isopeptidase USPL1 isoform X3 [Anopheles sinensis]|uniref:SUMO-specific isopeptidase USPL1 isoform X3 n=1 Tax=Anopheles sinensis TaxID=74873 RepID=A0A084WG12_ANOSI|nr:SUMO-specific isopeptidase USPL1 isoform X3 [Anopheles sinensis]
MYDTPNASSVWESLHREVKENKNECHPIRREKKNPGLRREFEDRTATCTRRCVFAKILRILPRQWRCTTVSSTVSSGSRTPPRAELHPKQIKTMRGRCAPGRAQRPALVFPSVFPSNRAGSDEPRSEDTRADEEMPTQQRSSAWDERACMKWKTSGAPNGCRDLCMCVCARVSV